MLGDLPYPGVSNQEVLERIKQRQLMPKPERAADWIYQMMTGKNYLIVEW